MQLCERGKNALFWSSHLPLPGPGISLVLVQVVNFRVIVRMITQDNEQSHSSLTEDEMRRASPSTHWLDTRLGTDLPSRACASNHLDHNGQLDLSILQITDHQDLALLLQ